MDSDAEKDELFYDDEDNDCGGFDLGHRLAAPRAQIFTTKQLHRMIHEGLIDVNPPYQRDVVWPEQKQTKLIDSIWRNYYVPPVVFTVSQDEDGEEVRRCVDGKQRLTSIQKFFDGQIPYKDWRTGKSWWFTLANSMRGHRSEIPPQWKEDFAVKTITCVEYHHLSPKLERDIFQRVQLGIPLTPAERLQAIVSSRQDWVCELEARFITMEGGLTQLIDVDVARGKDFQLIAQLVFCCEQYPAHSLPTAKSLENWLLRTDEPPQSLKDKLIKVLTAFWHIANTEETNYPFKSMKKRVSPAEFVFTGVLIFVLLDHSYEEQAEAIYNMRNHIRSKFPDIRMRTDIVKELWAFVEEVLDAECLDPPPPKAPSRKKGKKARVRDYDDEDDDEGAAYRARKRK
ncbi:hypothetical protein BD413DRAFT_614251 [Trametes elegans]|nr:hypothetical protein BD413DRAFT_614251 [Trametes elegans]